MVRECRGGSDRPGPLQLHRRDPRADQGARALPQHSRQRPRRLRGAAAARQADQAAGDGRQSVHLVHHGHAARHVEILAEGEGLFYVVIVRTALDLPGLLLVFVIKSF